MIKAAIIRTSILRASNSEAYIISLYCPFETNTRCLCSASSHLDSHTKSDDQYSSNQRKKHALSHGRSRRKLAIKKRDQEILTKKIEDKEESEILSNAQYYDESTQEDDEPIDYQNDNWHILKIQRGIPSGNPIRQAYIESQVKWKYPRTLEGWRICCRRAWNTYLWTWEGTLLSEKERDERGNIIRVLKKKEEDEEDEEKTITKETIKEKATDAAVQVSQNVQKNVRTIQQEAPKLLETAQRLTGIRTKEELRQWATEQLKLGTECLSMFMKGYREGRDKEVDNMLHEYFKELDETKQNASETSVSNGVDLTEEAPTARLRDDRPWGRNARRKQKRSHKQLPVEETTESAA